MREALLIGAAPGDGTGDPARTGGQKVNDNFAELYAFLGGDSLPTPLTTLAFSGDIADATGTLAVGQGGTGSTTLTAGSVLLGNGTGALSSFASTAGRLVIGNGGSGLTDDANLTWDATNKRLGIAVAPSVQFHTKNGEARFEAIAASFTGGSLPSSRAVGISTDASNNGLVIVQSSGGSSSPMFGIYDGFGTQLMAYSITDGLSLSGSARLNSGNGFSSGDFFNLTGVTDYCVFGSGNTSNPAVVIVDTRTPALAERATPLLRFASTTGPQVANSMAGINALDDGTRKGLAFYAYTGSAFAEAFRYLDDKSVRFAGGNIVLNSAALATTATDGFTYIPTSAGVPTGTPTAFTGTVAMQYDTTNNNLYVYNGAWKKVALA